MVLPIIEPMLASSGPIPGCADDWAFEPKLDGWRAMVYVADGWLMVRTRTGRNVTDQLPEVAPLPDVLDRRAVVLDGELVAHQGTPLSFYRLGPRMAARAASARSRRTPLTFVAFDLLWLDGDLTKAPYWERRTGLESLSLNGPAWCTASSFPGAGAELFAECVNLGLEGLVAKRLKSPYRPGQRSRDWVKAKTESWRPNMVRSVMSTEQVDNHRAGREWQLESAGAHALAGEDIPKADRPRRLRRGRQGGLDEPRRRP